MATVLLPKPKKDEDTWGAHPMGFFELNVVDVHKRLAQLEYMVPDAIASPIAQVYYANWALADLGTPLGRRMSGVVRAIVLLQYLRYLRPEQFPLSELGALGEVLRDSWETDRIICWRLQDLVGGFPDGSIVAASHPSNPFFPSARLAQDDQVWSAIRSALVRNRGPQAPSPLVDSEAQVADPFLAASLLGYLRQFVQGVNPTEHPWAANLAAWMEGLANRAEHGEALPIAKLGIALTLASPSDRSVQFGTYAGIRGREVWSCSACDALNEAWLNTLGKQEIDVRNQLVRCVEHGTNLRAGDNSAGPSAYGAYTASDGVMYVWSDDAFWPAGATARTVDGEAGEDGAVTYRFNRQDVTIRGRLVSLESLTLKRVAWMAGLQSRTTLDRSPVEIPVPAEYALLVASCEADDRSRQWTIQFHGLDKPVTVTYPDPTATPLWATSAIVLWPPQDCPGWQLDYFSCSTPLSEVSRFRVVEEAASGELSVSAAYQTNALYRSRAGKARYVELGELEKGQFRPLGLLAVNRPPAQQTDKGARGRIVFDFGTTNSAVLWHVQGASRPGFIRSGPDGDQPPCFLTRKEEEFKNLLRGVDILPAWNVDENPIRPYLPSLYAKPKPENPNSQPSIPPRGKGLHLLASPGGGEGRIISGLKWRDWSAQTVRAHVAALVELLLAPAYWELGRLGCGSVAVTATYPLAFGDQKKILYEKILREVTESLAASTGVRADHNSLLLVSESAAGSSVLPQANVTYSVVLDVGGGTTDIVVDRGPAGRLRPGEVLGDVLAADSIEYAGRDFLRAIVTVFGLEWLHRKLLSVENTLSPPAPPPDQGTSDTFVDAYVATLEALLHKRGVGGLHDLLQSTPQGVARGDNGIKVRDILLRWEALLAGLVLYARRIVEGVVATSDPSEPVTVNFNLFGQGWELVRMLGSGDPTVPLQRVIEPRLRDACQAVATQRKADVESSVQVLPAQDEAKTVVVSGAFKIAGGDYSGNTGGRLPAAEHALDANVRLTFACMDILRGKELVERAHLKLRDFHPRPNWAGDLGYEKLLDDLINTVPEKLGSVPLRSLVANRLFESQELRAHFGCKDVREHLVRLGQDDFNDKTWPQREGKPLRSLLDGFLSSVWRPVWAREKM